jgi:hypothetical protein
MSWDRLLQNDQPDKSLRERIDDLFAQQRATWATLGDGEAALNLLEKKTVVDADDSIIVQVNPARRRSTLANVDAKAVAARACFLCPENMPPEERGVSFEDLVLLPNPFPILPLHCTIANREHRPQQIRGRVATFLHLAYDLGPDMVALYNGPRCGASAPDHFHLQAARAADIPLLNQLPGAAANRAVAPHSSFGRNMVVYRNANAATIVSDIERTMDSLQRIVTAIDEPMLNLLAHFDARTYTVVLFPRAAHRPACYFASGSEQLLVSPAVLEMCGILVTTELEHFSRTDARVARKIYEEVSIANAPFSELIASI